MKQSKASKKIKLSNKSVNTVVQSYEELLLQASLDDLHTEEDEWIQKSSGIHSSSGIKRSVIHPNEYLVNISEKQLEGKDLLLNGKYFKIRDNIIQDKVKELNIGSLPASFVAAIPESTFLAKKLAPAQNNFKEAATGNSRPTPRYNSRVLEDLLRPQHEKYITEALATCGHLSDANLLLRSWFDRHQPKELYGKFPLTAIFLVLAEQILSPESRHVWVHAGASQLFKRALRWIVENDLAGEEGPRAVARLGGGIHTLDNFEDSDFSQVFPVVVIDASGTFNITYSTLASSYRLIRHQARISLAEENDEAVLTQRVYSFQRFDRLIRIPIPAQPKKSDNHYSADEEKNALCDGSWVDFCARKLDALIFRGLMETQRVKAFGLLKAASSSTHIIVGMNIDPEKAFRLVDRGPAADDVVAAGHFRALWGDKAELRRFKDGSIVESVVWPEGLKRMIPEMVIEHLTQIHPPFSHLNQQRRTLPISQPLEGTGEDLDDEQTREALKLYSLLEKRIRNSSSLPLAVNDVSIARAPGLRYTGFLPPRHFMAYGTRDFEGRKKAFASAQQATSSSNNIKKKGKGSSSSVSRYVPVTGEIFVKFESSPKWPDEPDVRKKLECALLVELARHIETASSQEETAEDFLLADCIVSSENFVDVLISGLAFRIRPIHAHQEEQEARLHSLFHSLHHRSVLGASRSFGNVARLCKRWVSGQRFSSLLSDDFVDLLISSLFINSFPMDPPRGGLSGLLRFFHFLATFDWKRRPLLLDLVDFKSPSAEVQGKADRAFFKQRASASAPPIVLYVRTKSDMDDASYFTPWMDSSTFLSETSLNMIIERAVASKTFLEHMCDLDEQPLELWQALFSSDVLECGFHAVLKLQSQFDALNSTQQQELVTYQNLLHAASRQALVGFDLVELLLDELRARFSTLAEFFVGSSSQGQHADRSSVEAIGIVWKFSNPQSGYPFKIPLTKCAMPVAAKSKVEIGTSTEEGKLMYNMDEILDEMARVGRGLVSDVERFI